MEKKKYQQFYGVFALNFYAYLHTGNSLHSFYFIDIMNIVFPVADFLCTSNIKLLIVVLGYFFRNYCEQCMFCSAVFIVTVAVSLFLNLMSQMT